jgi:PncC family amidohydrolase
VAGRIVARLERSGESVAVAESLTGGLVTAALTSVPGASEVVRGGVVAYAIAVKSQVLGVDADLLAARGPVHASVAEQMAAGARRLLRATYGVATTGEAGPGSASGRRVGTVVVAFAGPDSVRHVELVAEGDRWAVREAATEAALALLEQALGPVGP